MRNDTDKEESKKWQGRWLCLENHCYGTCCNELSKKFSNLLRSHITQAVEPEYAQEIRGGGIKVLFTRHGGGKNPH